MNETLWIARGGALGDVFVLAPALAALRVARPRATLAALGPSSALLLLRDAGLLDRVLDAENSEAWRAFAPGLAPSERLARALDGAEHLLSFGFGTLHLELAGRLRRGHVDRQPFPRESGLPVWRYLHATCARSFGPLPEPPKAPLAQLRRTTTTPRAWIQPGSGASAKNWPLDHFLSLARDLEARGIACSFALGEAEGEGTERALHRAGAKFVRADLASIARELAAARLVIGNDSGLVHLAALIGVPTLALFQASDERAWQPFGPQVRVLGARGEPATLEEARAVLRESIEQAAPL